MSHAIRYQEELPAVGTCVHCGEECEPTVQDIGIGSFECHGVKGRDVRLVVVSDCCEADVYDQFGETLVI